MKYHMKNNLRKGFTLIEILIVVAIIAILATVVLVGLGPTQQAGRDARRLSDLREVQQGLQLYFSKCGYYPGVAVLGDCLATGFTSKTLWADMKTALTGSNIGVSSVPNDPLNTGGAVPTYYYASQGASGSDYVIAAKLEVPNNTAFRGYTSPTLDTTPTDPGWAPGCGSTSSTYCLSL